MGGKRDDGDFSIASSGPSSRNLTPTAGMQGTEVAGPITHATLAHTDPDPFRTWTSTRPRGAPDFSGGSIFAGTFS